MMTEEKNYFISVSTRTTKANERSGEFRLDGGLINSLPDNHEKEKEKLLQKHEKTFPRIWSRLNSGDNIILCGVGSKRELLERFVKTKLKNKNTIHIQGYKKDYGYLEFVKTIQAALDVGKTEESILEGAKVLEDNWYLAIHSIDRLFCNHSKTKSLINRLIQGSSKKFHLIGTVDHINASLLWSTQEHHKQSLVWIETNTWQEYRVETVFHPLSILEALGYGKRDKQQLTLLGITHVYDSLTPNAQKIFHLILNFYKDRPALDKGKGRKVVKKGRNTATAREQEDSDSDSEMENQSIEEKEESQCLTFTALFEAAREEFFVPNESTLRCQLVEFKDHKLVRIRTVDGTEHVELLIKPKMIPKLIQELQER
ncbi:origin recognition complex subunit 2 [Brevipalpus obovatus]|uniref:origin recognition complex subunit 2 n=1 Tax=Brevipalpus obovatus TaxID=246614 RepID=UPI003D9F2DD8